MKLCLKGRTFWQVVINGTAFLLLSKFLWLIIQSALQKKHKYFREDWLLSLLLFAVVCLFVFSPCCQRISRYVKKVWWRVCPLVLTKVANLPTVVPWYILSTSLSSAELFGSAITSLYTLELARKRKKTTFHNDRLWRYGLLILGLHLKTLRGVSTI